MATRVLAESKPPTLRAGFVQRAAFYDNYSDTFSVDGKKKLREMVRAIPKNATGVQVEIVGVSVSLDSLSSNLALAQKRAEGVANHLQDRGIEGTYTVTVTATFTTDGAERALRSNTSALIGSDGKPLTTATINFLTPDRG
jgi:outer membrane protein OmpA-like peptidoglycan-associated protein